MKKEKCPICYSKKCQCGYMETHALMEKKKKQYKVAEGWRRLLNNLSTTARNHKAEKDYFDRQLDFVKRDDPKYTYYTSGYRRANDSEVFERRVAGQWVPWGIQNPRYHGEPLVKVEGK